MVNTDGPAWGGGLADLDAVVVSADVRTRAFMGVFEALRSFPAVTDDAILPEMERCCMLLFLPAAVPSEVCDRSEPWNQFPYFGGRFGDPAPHGPKPYIIPERLALGTSPHTFFGR